MLQHMTDSTPIVGSLGAGVLAQITAGPWWVPLVIQLVSLAVGYYQGRKVEVRKQTQKTLLDALSADQGQHGQPADLEPYDQQ